MRYFEIMEENRAIELINAGKYEEAAQLYIELIEARPDEPVLYVNFGNLLVIIKEYDRAANFFRKAIELDAEFGTAYVALGNLLYLEKSYDEAIIFFRKAMELGVHEEDVYYLLGMSLCKKEHFIQALPYLQRATELGEDVNIQFQYGLLLAQLSFLEDAEKVLTAVLEKEADHADALYNLGVIYAEQANMEKALDFIDRVLAVQPTHELALNARISLTK